jgi:hypothetical protein
MEFDEKRLPLSRTNLLLGGLTLGWLAVGLGGLAVGQRIPGIIGLFFGSVFGYRLYTKL